MLRSLVLFLTFLSMSAHGADWSVNSQESKLGFFATQVGAEFEGQFKEFSSTITFDETDLANSQVKILINIKSVDTQNSERDSNILNAEWFDSKTHPSATFETKEIISLGAAAYKAKSLLTMRGVTKEVELPFTVQIQGNKAHAKGELSVSRTAFGIGQGQWAVGTVVGDEVRIFFDLKADAQ
ncbi:YceI protein [Candidatus Terasakiella magnetica]|uniref:YceI protein n=1 Tax=Candidatus Terasakiella magnetica TaxID=1867952 RepID=A0A1C3RE71_9PROT|nr:YceI family protein [Candidatus Terasakiella magnetica]SCA55524.1 YceI protein [Candidatus Terasakiella magnetica]